MIRATTEFMKPARKVLHSEFHSYYDQKKELRPRRNKKSQVIISGEYIGTNPKCDGDNLCGRYADFVVTIRQSHYVSFVSLGEGAEIENQFRNYLLLCKSCMKLFLKDDSYIGEAIRFSEAIA